MNKKIRIAVLSPFVFAAIVILLFRGSAFGAHPLITDDTDTQGKGKLQFEFIGEYGYDREQGVTEKGYEIPTVPFMSYGWNDTVDIVFGLPYLSTITGDTESTSTVRGVGDASIEVKARFYERDGLSLAIKPGVVLPTGNEEKELGNGRLSYSAFLIATREAKPWAFHFNVGYLRNEFKVREVEETTRKNVWHLSIASQTEVVKDVYLVSNIGIERNQDKTLSMDPAFILGGLIYSLFEGLDIDIGVKAGLNRAETDYSLLAGITWRI